MIEIKQKQDLKFGFSDSLPGLEWVEICDALQRHWPHYRGSFKGKEPPVLEAARRMVRRRNHRPVPRWLACRSTVDYYDTILPLLIGCKKLDQPTSPWRYIRPMMVRSLMANWFRRIP